LPSLWLAQATLRILASRFISKKQMASRFGVPLIGMHACKYLMIHLLVEMHASVLACNECHLAAYTPASYDTCYNR
jgi:hypothetical protein